MKLKALIILFLLYCFATIHTQVLKTNTPTDSLLISSRYKNITIENFLDSLHQKHQFHFAYDPSGLPFDSVIDVNFTDQTINAVIQHIFKEYSPSVHISDKQVIISQGFRNTKVKDYIILQGFIKSTEDGKNLPLVNISITGEAIGTTSNFDGYYKFLIPRNNIGSKVSFSSIGYETKNIDIPSGDSLINLNLNPTTIKIREIEVKYLKAPEIIYQVQQNIPYNYPETPMLLTGFFRETIKQDGKYIEVSEAVLDIYKSSYNSDDVEKARFVKGRKSVDDKEISLARLKLAGGPSLFAAIDVVKHTNFFNTDDGVQYLYHYLGKGFEHGKVIYKVGFKPVIETENIYYQGELHIDTETYALISADFNMTKKTLKESEKYLIRKNAKKIKSTPIHTNYHIDYRPFGNKWILNSIRGELKIKILDKRNRKTKSIYTTTTELLITNAINGKGQKIKYSEAFKTNYILADKINNEDVDFWKDFNVINPEESLKNIFRSDAVEINVVPQREKTKP
ncbi:carboxypeptidase-like regulatory domain-containing protein [Plebeiibacterium marinum]|uniref:Carboxypeptidase-like regulatory domain-containing protein n=1 Tax=Plebeiibacterium marinum TaxID=2992111 RepID=A0AAE3MEY1_9BACT|nr:carboxypeptidase-like regulatory domain-containing protein [Plebeiobacterium marinum]MCW3806578.1 carboxypeptidase-like regulatory domain-containing protein [Plebeiobacterium marinum]